MKSYNMKFVLMLLVMVCITSHSLNAQQSKVGLISIFIDKNLTGNLNDEVLKALSGDDYFKFDSISEGFKEKFFATYAPNLPVTFIAEDSIISKPGYADLGLGEMNDSNSSRYQTPKGYVYINSRWGSKDKVSIANAFKLLPEDVDFIMIAYVDFSMVAAGSFGPISFNKMQAYVNFKIMDRTGKQVVSIKEYAKSEDTTTGVNFSGINFSDVKKLRPLCYQALRKLFLDLEKDLSKDSKKIGKKIAKWHKKNKK